MDVEFELSLSLLNRFTAELNHIEDRLRYDPAAQRFATERFLAPQNDDAFYTLLAQVRGELSVGNWFGLTLDVDTGGLRPNGHTPVLESVQVSDTVAQRFGIPLVLGIDDHSEVSSNGIPIGHEASETGFIRELFVRFSTPGDTWLSLELGRMNADVGSGLIYDDYGLAAQVIEAHIEGCAACRGELGNLRKVLSAVDTLPQISPSVGFDSAFARKLTDAKREARKQESKTPWWRRWWVPALAGALAAAALVFVLRSGPQQALAPPAEQASDTEVAEHLDLLQNYELVEQLDVLEDVDLVAALDELERESETL